MKSTKATLIIIFAIFCGLHNLIAKENTNEKIMIQHIRNATLKIDYAGKTILLDPMLGAKNSFMSFVKENKNLNPTVDLPFSIEDVIKGTDMILLTHSHLDHFDAKAMEVLDKDLPIYIQPSDEKLVKDANFNQVHIVNSSAEFAGIQIIRTTGVHGPENVKDMLGKVSGFVLKAENHPTIYIIGDCLFDNEIKENINRYQPDIIITNSGGAIFMNETILMDAQATIDLAKMAPKATIIATHMESLDHCTVTRKEIQAKAQEQNLIIHTPSDGEKIKL
ncbi:MBL fold metallo-hydrolase [Aureibacter tunicatorum]|uniref:L-ascorbate metabolism protein UlaG (Beta-lactamase superfamily) n=1 Tax=Aureibacter tunicatorum TaxID=866807 RepID=A0AAE3XRQ1_9BACT|nr:MBL fold metallo-hydrolase [Aureibacter tunicatorum]MDR6241387.1 L-ascorbate metabolism protein UlaG (beta-lactamase superfamily) [Aureibacter tunicatorum]BDD06768.1 hypothetical protein AUTU_42510 [Aureibacter tunicatorum]